MSTCAEVQHYLKVRAEGYASPEMITIANEHVATCVRCGGIMPGHADLQAIFSDMFKYVGHAEICKDAGCECRKNPPSAFDIEVIKQFRSANKSA